MGSRVLESVVVNINYTKFCMILGQRSVDCGGCRCRILAVSIWFVLFSNGHLDIFGCESVGVVVVEIAFFTICWMVVCKLHACDVSCGYL